MLGRLEVRLRRWRHRVSYTAWLARLLRLSHWTGNATAPGLVLIQIDGLSRPELDSALRRGEMPFLKRLVEKEQYRLDSLYAGVPSTTPAFQAELFYGKRAAVPAFNFRSRALGRLVRMFEPSAAESMEAVLRSESAGTGQPLLRGGACYSDNFTGGAAEAHFCPSSLGWGAAPRDRNFMVKILFVLGNLPALIRALFLLVVETILAVVDLVRGVTAGEDFFSELKFVPARVAITILLREMIAVGARMDIIRGLPVIHLNLLGYDEQAHRRGPSSAFAHWTLKGIDSAIGRIWRVAHGAPRRSYDVWLYSDHGQEQVDSYECLFGRRFSEAATAVFSDCLGGGRSPVDLEMATLGPVAHLYCNHALTVDERRNIAQSLVQKAGVPAVLVRLDASRLLACNRHGELSLPEQAKLLLGSQHPFLEPACRDLLDLVDHPDSGDFLALGWRGDEKPLSFGLENGAHGGPGYRETHAFSLLPGDISLTTAPGDTPRAWHLRQAAMRFLKARSLPGSGKDLCSRKSQGEESRLKVITYNVHSCVGMDGKISPRRIARVIARHKPDIVALQEVDVGRRRTGLVDQVHRIARYLDMQYQFHPAMHVEEGCYGNAVLSHLPMRLVRAERLPGGQGIAPEEPRGAIWVEVSCPGGGSVQVINTHLGLFRGERERQVAALLGERWLGDERMRGAVVLCGDFNSLPGSTAYRRLSGRLSDAQATLAGHTPHPTFSGRLPALRLDHLFHDPAVAVLRAEVVKTQLARVASDHLPLIIELVVTLDGDEPTLCSD